MTKPRFLAAAAAVTPILALVVGVLTISKAASGDAKTFVRVLTVVGAVYTCAAALILVAVAAKALARVFVPREIPKYRRAYDRLWLQTGIIPFVVVAFARYAVTPPMQWSGTWLLVTAAGTIATPYLTFRYARAQRAEKDYKEKTCPDCAETAKREANVCPHCGYRWRRLNRGSASFGKTIRFADLPVPLQPVMRRVMPRSTWLEADADVSYANGRLVLQINVFNVGREEITLETIKFVDHSNTRMQPAQVTGPALPVAVAARGKTTLGFHLATAGPLMFDELIAPADAMITADGELSEWVRLSPAIAAGVAEFGWLVR